MRQTRQARQVAPYIVVAILIACSISSPAGCSTLQAAKTQYDKALALEVQGKNDEAIAEYNKVLTSFADQQSPCVKAILRIAMCQNWAGRSDAAIATYNEFVNTFPNNLAQCSFAVFSCAEIYHEKKDYEKAAAEYRRMLDSYNNVATNGPFARWQLAASLRSLGRVDEALSEYANILADRHALTKDIMDAVNARIEVFRSQQRAAEADAEMGRAKAELAKLATDPSASADRPRLLQVAGAQIALGDKKGARATYDRILVIGATGDKPEVCMMNGFLYLSYLEDYARIIEEAPKALALYPNGYYEPEIQYFLAQAYDYTKQTDKALETYDTIVSKSRPSSDPKVREFACCSLMRSGTLLAELGRQSEAIAKLEQAVADYKDAPQAEVCEEKLNALKGGGEK